MKILLKYVLFPSLLVCLLVILLYIVGTPWWAIIVTGWLFGNALNYALYEGISLKAYRQNEWHSRKNNLDFYTKESVEVGTEGVTKVGFFTNHLYILTDNGIKYDCQIKCIIEI
jgi:hypothetical protein